MAVRISEEVKFKKFDSKSGKWKAMATLVADSKEDIVEGMKVIGLPKDTELLLGSSVITADGDFAYRKSDGSWNWV